MPTNFPSTLQLLPWVLGSLALLGLILTAAATAGLRRARLALGEERARAGETRNELALLEAARRELFERVSELQREVGLARRSAADLKVQLEKPSGPQAPEMIRLPMPQPLSARSTIPDTEIDWEVKLEQLEASLTQARRAKDESEQALRQSKLQAQRQKLEASKLASQVDDLALNLEETRVLVATKERQIFEATRHWEQAEDEANTARETATKGVEELRKAEDELAAQREVTVRAERMLQQARATIHEWESNVGETAKQLELVTSQLEQRQAAYATLERMLQEATASELQVRRDLKNLSSDREQLETQNLELKYILSQLGGGFPAQSSPRASDAPSIEPGTWPVVTESDIQDAVLGLRAIPSMLPQVPSPADREKTISHEPSDTERELRDARLRLQLLESGMGDLEYLREQNAKLRDELLQDKGAARELTALLLEHKRLKLDFQLAVQKLATQTETIERLSHATSELQDHKNEIEALGNLRAQLQDLHAENFALRNANSGTYRVQPAHEPLQSDAHELAASALDTAVLSDHLGLPVAVTGSLPAESLAAVSGIAAQIAAHVRELLPIGPISSVQWVDHHGMTVTCRLFKLAGDDMAMTVLAAGNPSEQALKQTLKHVLNSIGWTEDGPQGELTGSAAG